MWYFLSVFNIVGGAATSMGGSSASTSLISSAIAANELSTVMGCLACGDEHFGDCFGELSSV